MKLALTITTALMLTLTLGATQVRADDYERQSRLKYHYNPPSFQPVPPGYGFPGQGQRQPGCSPRPAPPRGPMIDCVDMFGFTGRLVDDGVLITRVIPGSEACRIGLHQGDTILRVEGYRIGCMEDWRSALEAGRGIPTFHVRQAGKRRVERIVARAQNHGAPPRHHDHGDRYDWNNRDRGHHYGNGNGPRFPQGNNSWNRYSPDRSAFLPNSYSRYDSHRDHDHRSNRSYDFFTGDRNDSVRFGVSFGF